MTEAIGNSGPLGRLLAAVRATAAQEGLPAPGAATPQIDRATASPDMIAVSKTAKAAIDAQEAAQEAVQSATGIPLSAGAEDLLDLDAARARAETGLKEMMQGLGISGDLDFEITVRNDGYVEVTSEHPRADEIEEAINSDPELRNNLVSVHAISTTLRVATAMSQAMEAARNDEANAETYFNWVRGIAEQTAGTGHAFSMSGGSLTASLVDAAGNRFGVAENLTLPA